MPLKITNISADRIPLHIALGDNRQVILGRGDVVWSPNEIFTNSISIYKRKNNISVIKEDKPEGVEYYRPYDRAMTATKQAKKENPKPLNIHVQNVGGDITETEKALKDALEKGKKTETITPEEFESLKETQRTVLDDAQDMVKEYKNEKKSVRWSHEDEVILRKKYSKVSDKEIAETLNKSEKSVERKISLLGLNKKGK